MSLLLNPSILLDVSHFYSLREMCLISQTIKNELIVQIYIFQYI